MNTITLLSGDALDLVKNLENGSVDLVLTDPPYFLERLDNSWNPGSMSKRTKRQAIKHLPAGMKFSPEQGKKLQDWYMNVALELLRVLKPGGFFMSFSSPRLVHRMAVAVEDAGFHVRDMFIWVYKQGWAKGASVARYAPKELRSLLDGWKTPQVRGNYEPIIVAQKPPEDTLTKNFLKYGVGLFNFENTRMDGEKTPSNVLATEEVDGLPRMFLIKKPNKEERGEGNNHPTVKPVALLRHLIGLATKDNALVLDPFVGSGSTAIAARLEGRRFIGFDINEEYIKIAKKRLSEVM